MPSDDYFKYIEKSKQVHASSSYTWLGISVKKHLEEIERLIQEHACATLLDYGCGKATMHQVEPMINWLVKRTLYDPALPQFSARPEGTYDIVLCVDVLEHIPEADVDHILTDLCAFTNKVLFLAISTRPAKRVFLDGENVHVTVKPAAWWAEKLQGLNKTCRVVAYMEHALNEFVRYEF